MPRSRLIAATLIAGLAAVACGDDTDPSNSGGQAAQRADPAAATSAAGAGDGAEAAPTVVEVAPVESVRLGTRFEWCPSVQDAWVRNTDGLSSVLGAVASYHQALLAVDRATDDLDRAEALEHADELEQDLDTAIDGYLALYLVRDIPAGVAQGFVLQVNGLIAGDTGGTVAVAYERALDAYRSAATQQDMTLLEEFIDIYFIEMLDRDGFEQQLELPMPPAVTAALQARAAVDPPPPSSEPPEELAIARQVADRASIVTGRYAEAAGEAADFISRVPSYAHLLDTDIQPAVDAYAVEAAAYKTLVAEVFAAALEEVTAVYDAADSDPDSDVRGVEAQAAEATTSVVAELVEDALQRLEAARVAAFEARDAAIEEVPVGTRNLIHTAINQASSDAGAADRRARGLIDSAVDAETRALFETQQAAADAARENTGAVFAQDPLTTVATAAQTARAAGLDSAVVAELMLYELQANLFDSRNNRFKPRGLMRLLVAAVTTETLIRSEAWRVLQQSLADDCQ